MRPEVKDPKWRRRLSNLEMLFSHLAIKWFLSKVVQNERCLVQFFNLFTESLKRILMSLLGFVKFLILTYVFLRLFKNQTSAVSGSCIFAQWNSRTTIRAIIFIVCWWLVYEEGVGIYNSYWVNINPIIKYECLQVFLSRFFVLFFNIPIHSLLFWILTKIEMNSTNIKFELRSCRRSLDYHFFSNLVSEVFHIGKQPRIFLTARIDVWTLRIHGSMFNFSP